MARMVKADAVRWAKSVCAAYEQTGGIPEWLLSATREAIEHSSYGVRLAFADYLMENCAEAMKYFADRT